VRAMVTIYESQVSHPMLLEYCFNERVASALIPCCSRVFASQSAASWPLDETPVSASNELGWMESSSLGISTLIARERPPRR
jgi:hypothetical protein